MSPAAALPSDADMFSGRIPMNSLLPANGRSGRCQARLVEADSSLRGVLAQGTAEFAGTPAVVYVYGTPEGTQRVVVVSVDGCRTLTAFDL
jgi:hypothetical protein